MMNSIIELTTQNTNINGSLSVVYDPLSDHRRNCIAENFGLDAKFLPYYTGTIGSLFMLILDIIKDITVLNICFPNWKTDIPSSDSKSIDQVLMWTTNITNDENAITNLNKCVLHTRLKITDNSDLGNTLNVLLAKITLFTITITKRDEAYDKIASFVKNISFTSLEKQNLEAEVTKANNEIKSLQQDKQNLEAEVAKANNEIKSLQQDKQNLEAEVATAETKIQSLKQYNDRLKEVCHSSYVKNKPVELTSETKEYIVRM